MISLIVSKGTVKKLKKNKYKKYKSCLILIAHGSKDPRWCKPFERIVNKLKKELSGNMVQLAYIEFALPPLSKVISNLRRKKVNDIKLLPLFMAVGFHIKRDIKEIISKTKSENPELKIEMLPPVGEHPKMQSLICEIIKEISKNC